MESGEFEGIKRLNAIRIMEKQSAEKEIVRLENEVSRCTVQLIEQVHKSRKWERFYEMMISVIQDKGLGLDTEQKKDLLFATCLMELVE